MWINRVYRRRMVKELKTVIVTNPDVIAKLEKFNNTEDVYLTSKELMTIFPNIKLKKYI